MKLLENFESYAAQFTEPLEDIELFNAVYRDISQVFSAIVEQGIEDGSVQADLPIAETLTTIVNTFGILPESCPSRKTFWWSSRTSHRRSSWRFSSTFCLIICGHKGLGAK